MPPYRAARTRFIYALAAGAHTVLPRARWLSRCGYCRVRACRVYAELDTLVADSEVAAAADLAKRACELGVDAIIAQDLGFISIARAVAPDIPVFAGDRLGIHNAAGAQALRQLGVKRIFLPRELSLGEIKALASRSGVELAVLVHGRALPGQRGAVLALGPDRRQQCQPRRLLARLRRPLQPGRPDGRLSPGFKAGEPDFQTA